MIKYNSNLVMCQMDLLKQCDELLRLLNGTEQDLLNDINRQDFPLLYEICLNDFAMRVSKLRKSIENIQFRISEVK